MTGTIAAFLLAPSNASAQAVCGVDPRPVDAPENFCRNGVYSVDTVTLERARIALTEHRWIVRSPDGRRILYQERGDLFVADLDGSAPVRLNPSPLAVAFVNEVGIGASFSPDGRRVAFTAYAPCTGDACAKFHVYVARLDGTGRRRVGPGMNPSWSGDGRWIAYSGDLIFENDGPGRSVYVARSDGGGRRRLGRGTAPVFAPRGPLVAHVCDERTYGRICVSSVRDGSRRVLPGGYGSAPAYPGSWSPDASRLAYLAAERGRPSVLRIAAFGSARPRVTVVRNAGVPTAWSADGSRLVYLRDLGGGSRQLFLKSPSDRSGGRQLTFEPAYTAFSNIRMEGRRLTFAAAVYLIFP